MADYKGPDGCYGSHNKSDPNCETHKHAPMWAAKCGKCADMVKLHRHDPFLAEHCWRCRELSWKVLQ